MDRANSAQAAAISCSDEEYPLRRLSRRRLARRGYRACADDGRKEYRDDDGRGTKMIAWFDITA